MNNLYIAACMGCEWQWVSNTPLQKQDIHKILKQALKMPGLLESSITYSLNFK